MHQRIAEPYLRSLSPIVVFLLRLLGSLLVEKRFIGFRQLYTLLTSDGQGVVGFVPLAERRRVDGNDGVFDEGLGPDQLVVARVVDGVDDSGLAGDSFGSPREVAGVQSGERERQAVNMRSA